MPSNATCATNAGAPALRCGPIRIDLAIGSSGTIRNVADHGSAPFLQTTLQQDDVLTHAHLRQVVALLAALPLEERRKVSGMQPERADIILAGAAILDAFMQELRVPEIHISERGARRTPGGLPAEALWRCVTAGRAIGTRRSVLQLGRACHFDETHAQTTARLALGLFDSARDVGYTVWERGSVSC
jgi:exopolyphosphatase/guanosine-5'-triphosphate,3'-diphosphate pyrophosphatase